MDDLFKQLSTVRENTAEDTLAVASALFDAAQKLVHLNLDTARSVLEGGAMGLSTLLQAKNPEEIIAMQTGLVRPATERTTAYYRDCYDILLEVMHEVARPLEKQAAQASSLLYNQFGLGRAWSLGNPALALLKPSAKAKPAASAAKPVAVQPSAAEKNAPQPAPVKKANAPRIAKKVGTTTTSSPAKQTAPVAAPKAAASARKPAVKK